VTFTRRAPKMWILLSSRRTSPLVFDGMQNNQALHVVAAAGGGRSSAISRRMSANRSRDGDPGHLECDVAAMADDLRADFDELLFQGCQRSRSEAIDRKAIIHRCVRSGWRSHKIARAGPRESRGFVPRTRRALTGAELSRLLLHN
jgi:hypothetical protein